MQRTVGVHIWRQISLAMKLTSMLSNDDLFKGRHFDREIIILGFRWYIRLKLNFRVLVEMMAERGIYLAHTTIKSRASLRHRPATSRANWPNGSTARTWSISAVRPI
jgi:transposase-like protein